MFGLPPLPASIEREIRLGKAFALAAVFLIWAAGFVCGALAAKFVG